MSSLDLCENIIWQSQIVIICLTPVVLILIYLFVLNKSAVSYWKIRGVNHIPPTPFLSKEILKSFLIEYRRLSNIYKESGDSLCCGFYQFRKPVLLIKCPRVINLILNRDFKLFSNKRLSDCTEGNKDPLAQHLLALNGQKWTYLRSKLTPSFTPEKLKFMFYILDKCVDGFVDEIEKADGSPVDVKSLCGKLSMDSIAACAFGLDLKCVRDENKAFIAMSGEAFKAGFWPMFKAHLRILHPKVFKALFLNSYSKDTGPFFCGLVDRFVQLKRCGKQTNVDFITTLLKLLEEDETENENLENFESQFSMKFKLGHSAAQASRNINQVFGEGSSNERTNRRWFEVGDLIAAQVFSFFVGGYETTSIAMSNALYELARNERIKSNIRNEIDGVIGKNDITYENINSLKYLHCFIEEVLRIYPPVFYVQRFCSEDYQIPNSDVIIEKNMEVIIPILELHHDPNYFEEPMRCIPERFNSTNKSNIKKGTYLPFGDGPRQCIGFRFSLLELKLALAKTMMEFDVTLDSSTPEQLTFQEYSRVYRVKNKIMLRFSKKSKSEVSRVKSHGLNNV